MRYRLFYSHVLLAVILSVFVFFLFRYFFNPGLNRSSAGMVNPGQQSFDAGYAVLVFDESRNDRQIRETIHSGGIEEVISESSQDIPVDDFGEFKMIPLDSYRKEIEVFDPRDDGYADKLRSFFVHDGIRLFFLPLKDISIIKANYLKKHISSLFGDTPFTFGILEFSRPVFWYFLLLAAACGCAFYLSGSKRLLIFILPLQLAFGWIGPSAFVLAAVFSGILELLKDPLREFLRPNGSFIHAGAVSYGAWERFRPFIVNLLLVLFFLAFFVVFSIIMELPPIPLAAGFGCFIFLCFLGFRAEAYRARENKHILFIPLPLLPLKARTFSLFPVLFPFCTGSILILSLSVFFPVFSPFRGGITVLSGNPEDLRFLDSLNFINSEDYYRHINFQRSFSYRSLDQNPEQNSLQMSGGEVFEHDDYLRYYLGNDGLIAGGMDYVARTGGELPPFPLEKLMEFLVNYSDLAGTKSADMAKKQNIAIMGILGEWIPAAIILAFCILDLYRPWTRGRKMKKTPIFRDKRIAA